MPARTLNRYPGPASGPGEYAATRRVKVKDVNDPTVSASDARPPVKARIAVHHGVPALFIDGRPTAALAYMTFNLQEKYVRDFARAGVELYSFETTSDYDYYRLSADAWPARGAYDYSQFDERMEIILRAAPGAKVFPRVCLCSPPWWDRAHPDQLMAGKGGVYDPSPDFGWLPASMSEKALGLKKMTVPSFSSKAWLEDSGAALQRFLRYAEERYGHAIIGYHDDPAAMADIARMVRIGRKAMHLERASVAEIAVVLDDDSIHFTRCDNRLTVPLIADQLMQMGHVGAPFSMIHVDDLASLPRHKLYVFLNLFYVSEERLRMVREVTQRPGASALYFYAPGLVGEDLSAERMERLTGIRLVLDERDGLVRVRVDPGVGGTAGWHGHAPLRGHESKESQELGRGTARDQAAPLPAEREIEYGLTEPLAPVVYADDPQAECLGRLIGSDRAGLVRKRVGRGTAIFSAAPAMPAELLRRLASEAGVHIYADGAEVVYANRSFLAVCASPGARVRLRLPARQHLYDLFEEKEVALPDGAGALPPSGDGVSIFFRGRRKEWDAIAP